MRALLLTVGSLCAAVATALATDRPVTIGLGGEAPRATGAPGVFSLAGGRLRLELVECKAEPGAGGLRLTPAVPWGVPRFTLRPAGELAGVATSMAVEFAYTGGDGEAFLLHAAPAHAAMELDGLIAPRGLAAGWENAGRNGGDSGPGGPGEWAGQRNLAGVKLRGELLGRAEGRTYGLGAYRTVAAQPPPPGGPLRMEARVDRRTGAVRWRILERAPGGWREAGPSIAARLPKSRWSALSFEAFNGFAVRASDKPLDVTLHRVEVGVAPPGSEAVPSPRTSAYRPRIEHMLGSVGWPSHAQGVEAWKKMGLTWNRDSVGPGRAGPGAPMDVTRTGPGQGDLREMLAPNNRHGFRSLLLLGYSEPWNTATGDGLEAPKSVRAWEEYVEAAVSAYSAPPYGVRYYQIWNEAAGRILSAPQSSFWHGPGYPDKPYERAMEDYVERVHLPAARIIRKHGGIVVYGGWPDQAPLEEYERWLRYRDMWRWVDYLDIHYRGVRDMEALYRAWVATGRCKGVWQTEIGDTYCKDPTFLARFLFDMARWALERDWDHPEKYVAMVYHWSGPEDFRLTQWGREGLFTPSGRSLIALRSALNGPLAAHRERVWMRTPGSAAAIRAGDTLVVQVSAGASGPCVVVLDAVASPATTAPVLDAVTGETIATARLGRRGAVLEARWDTAAPSLVRLLVPLARGTRNAKGAPSVRRPRGGSR